MRYLISDFTADGFDWFSYKKWVFWYCCCVSDEISQRCVQSSQYVSTDVPRLIINNETVNRKLYRSSAFLYTNIMNECIRCTILLYPRPMSFESIVCRCKNVITALFLFCFYYNDTYKIYYALDCETRFDRKVFGISSHLLRYNNDISHRIM